MRFLLDQSADARLAGYLREHEHDATRIGRDHPRGLDDVQVLKIAHTEGRILITDDRNFGDLVFHHHQVHAGVIHLRLGDFAELSMRMSRLEHVLAHYRNRLDRFLVVTPNVVRVHRAES